MVKNIFALFFFFVFANIFAQQLPSYEIHSVVVGDRNLRTFSGTQSLLNISDSVKIQKSRSLTESLRYNSTIYFKESGFGMVSSPSFRGTTAQQTAVVWHGININSQLNGQTDFNTVVVSDQQTISVRGGGGSVLYGSSAIGGTINLDSRLLFEAKFISAIQSSVGSFGTSNFVVLTEASNKNTDLQVTVSRKDSENDYKYLGTNRKNRNGQFHNTNIDVSLGQKIGDRNVITFYGQSFEGERHFSGTKSSVGQSRYEDFNFRNIINWENSGKKHISNLTVASLKENYRYFSQENTINFDEGNSETYLAKHHFQFTMPHDIEFHTIFQESISKGWGSDLKAHDRNIFESAVLLTQDVNKFEYEIGARIFVNDQYGSPVLFSAGAFYKIVEKVKLRANVSRSFRMPTFNDLYWKGSGNDALKPESAFQYEAGAEFDKNNIFAAATVFYNDINEMLRWTPNSSGNWTPQNVQNVAAYGCEVNLQWHQKIGESRLMIVGKYSYTVSEDQKTKRQLIYVPFQIATANIIYGFRKISIGAQALRNGDVFTSSDNSNVLDGYVVSNFSMRYNFSKYIECGVEVLNTFDQEYANVLNRPMPGRNYSFLLTLNI